mgnify:CR=1 FL=1
MDIKYECAQARPEPRSIVIILGSCTRGQCFRNHLPLLSSTPCSSWSQRRPLRPEDSGTGDSVSDSSACEVEITPDSLPQYEPSARARKDGALGDPEGLEKWMSHYAGKPGAQPWWSRCKIQVVPGSGGTSGPTMSYPTRAAGDLVMVPTAPSKNAVGRHTGCYVRRAV